MSNLPHVNLEDSLFVLVQIRINTKGGVLFYYRQFYVV